MLRNFKIRVVLKIVLYVSVAIWMLTIIGCWNRVELDQRAIVKGSAIDKAPGVDGKLMVTTEIVNPPEVVSPLVGGGGDAPASWIISSTGWTIFDAVRNMVMQSDKKLFWSHSRVIIIGEGLAREGVAPVLDFYTRDHELRRNTTIIIAKGSTGKEIIGVEHKIGGVTSRTIDSLSQAAFATSAAVQVPLSEFIGLLLCDKCAAIAGRIEFIESGEPEGKLDEGEGTEEAEENEENGEGNNNSEKEETELEDMKDELIEGEFLRYSGAAVFKGDRLVGWLDRKEARGLNWVKGNIESGIIVIKSPEDQGKNTGIEIISADSKVKTEFKDGKPHITIEIEVTGNIGDQLSSADLRDKLGIVEKRMAEVVRNEIEASLKKAQELESDILCFLR